MRERAVRERAGNAPGAGTGGAHGAGGARSGGGAGARVRDPGLSGAGGARRMRGGCAGCGAGMRGAGARPGGGARCRAGPGLGRSPGTNIAFSPAVAEPCPGSWRACGAPSAWIGARSATPSPPWPRGCWYGPALLANSGFFGGFLS